MKKINKEILKKANYYNLEIGYNSIGLYSIYKLKNGYTLSNTLRNYKNINELIEYIEILEMEF